MLKKFFPCVSDNNHHERKNKISFWFNQIMLIFLDSKTNL